MEAEKFIALLERDGKLRKQKAGISQVEALLRQAVLDLEEARVIVSLAGRAAYVMAYMAMLKAGRALLLERGYVPDDGAQHKTVVDVTGVLLGEEYKAVTSHFEIMRRKRNDMTYEAGALISARESEKAFSDAVQLLKGVIAQVKGRNRELRFDF